jgi:hypothetical protein
VSQECDRRSSAFAGTLELHLEEELTMITGKIAAENRAKTPHPASEEDAAAWAGLLDEWLGPDNDVYARLLKRPKPDQLAMASKRSAEASAQLRA